MISLVNRKLKISMIKRNFCDFLKGTRGYKKKYAEEIGRVAGNQTNISPDASNVNAPPNQKKEEKENSTPPQNKEEVITEEDFNRLEKEYHMKDSGRSMKGSSLGRKESKTKEKIYYFENLLKLLE